MFVMLSCLFLAALWSPAGKVLTSWLSCVLGFRVFLSLFHLVSGSGVVYDCIDSLSLLSFFFLGCSTSLRNVHQNVKQTEIDLQR